MKKLLALVLALAMVLAFAAPAMAEDPAPYTVLGLDLKNKTGATINAMYIYPAGAEDKGASICPAEWKDKDADGDNYEIFVYIVRDAAEAYDVTVVYADGTDKTLSGAALKNYDKISMKGIEVEDWELEACDDAGDIEKLDALKAAGKTSDNFYPGYAVIGLEIKNKTGVNIKELYIYTAGNENKGNDLGAGFVMADGSPINGCWPAGGQKEGGCYQYCFIIREVADEYDGYVVYADEATEPMTIEMMELLKPNGDGFLPNEISMKDPADGDLTKVDYDDGEDALTPIAEAIAAGIPADGWYPVY